MSTVRLILIGKTGNGKSETGNKILGQTVFQPSCGLSSGTDKCAWKKGSHGTLTLEVTDTPGVCDTHKSEGEVEREIAKCVATMTPGPDAILFVVRGKDRFTEEEFRAFEKLKAVFGKEMIKYMILVLTRITQEEFQEYMAMSEKALPPKLIRILREAGNRCVCFGNDSSSDRSPKEQEREMLIRSVLSLKTQNRGIFYSNDLVKKFDHEMKKKAQTSDTNVDVIKERIVEEKEEGFLAWLYKSIPIPSVLRENQYCTVM